MSAASRLRKAWRSRTVRIVVIVVGVLLVLGVILDRGVDEPLRRLVERRINERLSGYTSRVGGLDFHLIGLSMDLENTQVVQNAHPTPPVLTLPRLKMSVRWKNLLNLRVVADAVFQKPSIHVNLVQLDEETGDPVPVTQRGWQDALEAIYPLKINQLRVENGTVTYEDDSGYLPLHLSEFNLVAGNIRNIRSADRQYPSTLHAEARVFDIGKAVIDGHADFLAKPTPGVKGNIQLERIELSYFEPLAKRLGLSVKQGEVTATGAIELARSIQSIDIESIVMDYAVLEYTHAVEPTPQARAATDAAQEALNNPEMVYRVRQVLARNAKIGLVNTTQSQPYHLFVSGADFELENLSSRAEDGPARATLRGAFNGSGTCTASGTFYPEGQQAHFEAKVAIENTKLVALNELLRARGKFDVTRGTLTLYSELTVQDGAVDGYVKPLFRDVEVLDADQDRGKNVFHKMYEGVVGGLAKILENRRGDVASVTSLKGTVEDPKANTFQVMGTLIRNAFIRAIAPGFQHELARADAIRYMEARKKDRHKEHAEKDRASLRR